MINNVFLQTDYGAELIELAVIINSFNRLELLQESLPSVVDSLNISLPKKYAVVIFDAGSTDGSIEFIQKFANHDQTFPLILISPPSSTDRSFAAGCNCAIQQASATFSNLKWCFLFETDNFITNPNAISLGIKLLEKEDNLAGVGFTVKGAGFGSTFPTPISFVLGQQISHYLGLQQPKIDNWYPIAESSWGYSDIVFTSPILIKHSVWQSTGGMDAIQFPFSDSDCDWCWTVHEKGWRLAVINIFGVTHDNRKIASEWSSKRVLDYHRARLRLLIKHRGAWVLNLKPFLAIRHYLEFFILLVKSILSTQAKNSLSSRVILIKTVLSNYENRD
jgi:GT2 family glycosyltransferase